MVLRNPEATEPRRQRQSGNARKKKQKHITAPKCENENGDETNEGEKPKGPKKMPSSSKDVLGLPCVVDPGTPEKAGYVRSRRAGK